MQLLTGGPLALFAQQLPAGAAINLLQGSYAPTSTRGVGLRAWRVAAMLLAGLVALHVAARPRSCSVLKKRERQVDASIRETFHRPCPAR